jgi:hypothetical protein
MDNKITTCPRKHYCERWVSEHDEPDDPHICGVCELYDARREAAEKGTVLPFYVLAVGMSRHYGGPEEGGWWYDMPEILGVKKAYTFKQGLKLARELKEEYPQPRYNRFSCANRGEPDVHLCVLYGENDPRWPGEDFERPRYE